MKVLYVDQTGELGGGELSLLDIVKHSRHQAEVVLFSDGPFRALLEQLGIRVHLLLPGKAGEVRREAGVFAVVRSLPALLALRTRLAHLARSADVLYANSQKAFLVSALARHRNQPLFWHLRDILTAKHFSPLIRRIAVTTGNLAASTVICNSQATRDAFVSAGGKLGKAQVIYNGISARPFDLVRDDEVAALRIKLGLQSAFVVGAFGRLTPWKGQHILLESLKSLAGTHALIVGEALFGEHAYAQQLRDLAISLGIADRVHFLGFRQDIELLMKCCDVIVHNSTSPEPFGRVIVEAMLAKRPVIATRAGGAIEIIEDQISGLLISPGSSPELCLAIQRIAGDPAFARDMVAAARQRATSMFSVEALATSIDNLMTGARMSGTR